MQKVFTGAEFLKALSTDKLKKLIVRTGMAKKSDEDPDSILFTEGPACSAWIAVPVDMIDSVEHLSTAPCDDHEHPVVQLTLKHPAAGNKEAAVLMSFLHSPPRPSFENRKRDEPPIPGDSARSFPPDDFASFMLRTRRNAISGVPAIPLTIGNILAEEYAIDQVTGGIECATAIQGILDYYNDQVSRATSDSARAGLARNAAMQIKNYACRSYCNCGR